MILYNCMKQTFFPLLTKSNKQIVEFVWLFSQEEGGAKKKKKREKYMLWDFLILIPDWNVMQAKLRKGNVFMKNKNEKNDQYCCCWLTRTAQQILIHFSFFSGQRYALPGIEADAVKRIKLGFLLKSPLKRRKLNICSHKGQLITSTASFFRPVIYNFSNVNPAIWDSVGSYGGKRGLQYFQLFFMTSTSSYPDMSTSFYFCISTNS